MVMHARKPQRMSDGYFEKHQSHPYQSSKYGSKRDYERESSGRSSSSYLRDRDANTASPLMGSHSLNGGSYGSSGSSTRRGSVPPPDMDSPPRDHRSDRDRGGDSSRYSSSSYTQKMRDKDRDRDVYKKDKYFDKRDRRESEHRSTNHDRMDTTSSTAGRRSSKLALPSGGPQSSSGGTSSSRAGSLERDREPRGGDHESSSSRDRGGGIGGAGGGGGARIGDWSEHVSSSGKKYYYNCKTEVSQWEKPREWLLKEQRSGKDIAPPMMHRSVGEYRDKDRDRGYGKHSGSSSSRAAPPSGGRRWPPDSSDMGGVQSSQSTGGGHHDHHGSSSRRGGRGSHDHDGPSSRHHHASQPHHQQLGPHSGGGQHHQAEQDISSEGEDSTPTSEGNYSSHRSTPTRRPDEMMMLHNHHLHHGQHHPHATPAASGGNNGVVAAPSSGVISTSSLMVNALPRLSSHPQQTVTTPTPLLSPSAGAAGGGNHLGMHPHSRKVLMGVEGSGQSPGSCNSMNSGNMMDSGGGPGRGGGGGGVSDGSNVSLANLPKILSQITGNKQIDHAELNPQKALQTINNALLMSSRHQQAQQQQMQHLHHHHHGHYANGGGGLERSVSSPAVGGGGVENNGALTQDGAGVAGGVTGAVTVGDIRKLDYNSCSSLQGVMAQRNQGPSLTPSLANFFRADLITHVTNWPADMLEKQAQKLSEEAHMNGDLQCAWVSADLKSARSVVRRTEIIATLYEQKIMYLRQQFQRLEELKSQNSFMSDDL